MLDFIEWLFTQHTLAAVALVWAIAFIPFAARR